MYICAEIKHNEVLQTIAFSIKLIKFNYILYNETKPVLTILEVNLLNENPIIILP